MSPAPGEQHAADGRVVADPRERVDHLAHRLRPERVADLRPVDRDLGDARAGVLVADVVVLGDAGPGDGGGHAAVLLQEVEGEAVGRRRVVSRCGRVAGAVDDGEPGARDPGGHGLGAVRAGSSRAPAMTSVGARDLAEAIVERLHRALSGAAQARGRGPPDRLASRISRMRAARAAAARPGSRRWAAPPTRRRTRRSRRARSCAARRLVGGPPGVASRRVGDPGRRALEDEPVHDVGVRDGEPQRDPGAERVADHVGRRGVEATQDRGEVVGRPSPR